MNNIYKISEAAKKLGISRSTLIRWEKQQLIKPVKRNYLNYRMYTKRDIEKIRKTMKLDTPLLDQLENGMWPTIMREMKDKTKPEPCPFCGEAEDIGIKQKKQMTKKLSDMWKKMNYWRQP